VDIDSVVFDVYPRSTDGYNTIEWHDTGGVLRGDSYYSSGGTVVVVRGRNTGGVPVSFNLKDSEATSQITLGTTGTILVSAQTLFSVAGPSEISVPGTGDNVLVLKTPTSSTSDFLQLLRNGVKKVSFDKDYALNFGFNSTDGINQAKITAFGTGTIGSTAVGELLLQMSNDFFGGASMKITNRSNANGITFILLPQDTTNIRLIDFILSHPGGSRNIRLEGRTGECHFGVAQEWQFGSPGSTSPHLYSSEYGLMVKKFSTLTTTIEPILRLRHRSSNAPNAGFGSRINFQLKTSTTENKDAADIDVSWDVATEGSQDARMVFKVYGVTTAYEVIRIQADRLNTKAKLSFFGATAVARPTAYTQNFTTATRTVNAYTTDAESSAYTGIDNAQGGTVYATVADLNSLRVAYENLRASYDNLLQVTTQMIDDFQAYGLLQ
jgi:hypothetical protein